MPGIYRGPLSRAQDEVVGGELGVTPDARRGDPGERMEPPQRQRDFADQLGEPVEALHVGKLVEEHQPAALLGPGAGAGRDEHHRFAGARGHGHFHLVAQAETDESAEAERTARADVGDRPSFARRRGSAQGGAAHARESDEEPCERKRGEGCPGDGYPGDAGAAGEGDDAGLRAREPGSGRDESSFAGLNLEGGPGGITGSELARIPGAFLEHPTLARKHGQVPGRQQGGERGNRESAREAGHGHEMPRRRRGLVQREERNSRDGEERGRLHGDVEDEAGELQIERIHQRSSFLASPMRRESLSRSSSESSSRDKSRSAATAFSVEPSKKVSSTLRRADRLARCIGKVGR